MNRIRELVKNSPGKIFIATRGTTSGMALLIALSYTKLLGIDKRSVLAFVMVGALLLTILFTSGLSLGFRNRPTKSISSQQLSGFLMLITVSSFIVGSINCTLLLIYDRLKVEIPLPIFLVCFVYSFLACMNMGFQDALIASGNLKLASFFDFITIILQGCGLLIFLNIEKTSLIISVFVSFIVSYAFVSVATIMILLPVINNQKFSVISGIREVIAFSKNNHLYGIANGFVDRIDRLIIGLIMPISYLAKYALMSSIITFTRFLPEALNKVKLLKIHDGMKKTIPRPTFMGFFLLGALALCVTILSQFFISIIFGDNWLLPIYVAITFSAQELLRGYYQSKAVGVIASGESKTMSSVSTFLIISAFLTISLGVYYFGALGAPLAMVITYSFAIMQISRLSGAVNDK